MNVRVERKNVSNHISPISSFSPREMGALQIAMKQEIPLTVYNIV